MSRWFRHYAGLCRDEKLVSVAIKAKQPVERVVWVWAAILESAAEIDDGGKYSLDAAEAAYFLRADQSDIDSITSALANAGRVDDGVVVNWGNRQFSSDKSRDRVAAYRERKRSENSRNVSDAPSRNDDVTLHKRYGNAPDTDTDTETDNTNNARERASASPSGFDEFWKAYPHKVGRRAAEKSFALAVKRATLAEIMAGLAAYAAKTDDRPWCNPATWLNQDRWTDRPAINSAQKAISASLAGVSIPSAGSLPGKHFVALDSPQWRAWAAHRGRSPPTQDCRTERGIERGWFFETEWPPASDSVRAM